MATKRVNIDIVAKDKSQRALQGVRGSLDKLKSSVFNVRNALAGLGGGLVIRNLVNTGKEIESLQVRLKFLFGSAEEGAKAFDEMAQFAAKVPFSLEQIQQGAGVLSVVSKDADELADILEITGNVAAVTGLDFRTASEQIQRSLSAGIASADLFREKGVRDLLGFKAGATVTAEETALAFERVFGKGGRFGGATDELAQTLEGTLSMIGDKVFNFKKTLLDAGFFAELKNQFGDLDKFLQKNAKTLDDVAIKIGKGMAEAVQVLADAVVFVKNNFDSFVLVLEGLIALKVAKVLFGIQVAISGMTVAMKGFNMATKKNIIFASIATFVTGMGFLIHKFKQFKNEMNEQNQIVLDNTSTIADYKKEIEDLGKKIAEMESLGKVMDENQTPITALKVTLELLNEELDALKEVINETTNDTAALGQSLHGNFHTILKEGTKTLKEYTDGLVAMNIEQARLEDRQFGMSDKDKESVKEHTKFLNLQKETLSTINDHMRVKNQLTAEQAGLFTVDKIVEELKKEEEQLKKTMQVYAEFAMQRRRLSLQTLREEREQSKNNQHKMFDDALANESKMVELKENTKKLTMEKGRELIAELAKNNREMFMINKALAVKDAIMATAQGITNALKLGPIGIPLAAIIGGLGAVQIATIARQQYQGRAGGGAVNKDQAYMVGEKGPEMFVPSGSGKIVPNNQMGSGQPVNVNFNINTVDARGFNELLVNSRGVIINMINSAVNEKGRMAIV
jgi:hypothetical protein